MQGIKITYLTTEHELHLILLVIDSLVLLLLPQGDFFLWHSYRQTLLKRYLNNNISLCGSESNLW